VCQYDSWARMLRPYGIASRTTPPPRNRHRIIAPVAASPPPITSPITLRDIGA
jgi:hypothetical protein